MDQYRNIVDEKLEETINKLKVHEKLKESMLYSVQAGGKRVRPLLLIASNKAFNGRIEKVYSSAIALEMIHTYSLIHDDLPAMDDDDYRRGKLTNHKVFDEATAILAGDALLTYSFEVIAADDQLQDDEKVFLLGMLAKKSGPQGMVAGQILDIEAEQKEITLEELENIHRLKTGELLKFPILAGAYLAGATDQVLLHIEEFAHYIGLIFQIQDDILDVIGDEEKLGKPVGSDEINEKNTYPKLLGLEGAIHKRDEYVEKAKESLGKANASTTYLDALTEYIMERDH